MPALSRDILRSRVLRWLYDMHESGQESEVREVFLSRFREKHPEYAEDAPILASLRYLALKGWLLHEPGNYLSLTAEGIDLVEGADFLRLPRALPKVAVFGAGEFAIVGDGDVVRAERVEVFQALRRLASGAAESPGLTERRKHDLGADLGALLCQARKERPDPATLAALWKGVRAGFAGGEDEGEGESAFAKPLERAGRLVEAWIADLG